MNADSFLSAIVVGLVIGALGRLVVPGRQPIGCLLTILLGIVGAFGGQAIAREVGVESDWLLLACQVAVAALGVAVVAAAMIGRRRRPRPPERLP